MTPETIQFLNDNRHHHTTLVKAFYLRSLSGEVRSRMQQIIADEFQPGYSTDLWCGPCISAMVLKLYKHYDEWLAQQPVKVEANFPSNKDE
jgi:hypothetical protein